MQANTFQRWKIIIFPGITTSVREAVYPGIRQADFDPSRLFIQRSPKTSDFACWPCHHIKPYFQPLAAVFILKLP